MEGGVLLMILMLLVMASAPMANGVQYVVGDNVGWGLGNDLDKWVAQHSFHVGDDLLFSYPSGQHSVLLVSEGDFNDCNTDNPIASDDGQGNMAITLVSAETYFFICGVPGHCAQGLRLSVEVKDADTGPGDVTPPPADVPPPVDDHVSPPPPVVEDHVPPPVEDHVAPPPPVVEDHVPPPADEHHDTTTTPPAAAKDSPPYYKSYTSFRPVNSASPLLITLSFILSSTFASSLALLLI